EDPGDGDHRRARTGQARHLRRCGRLPRLERQHGHRHRDPHRRGQGRQALHPGGRRRGRGFDPPARVEGIDEQGPGNLPRGRDGGVAVPVKRGGSGRRRRSAGGSSRPEAAPTEGIRARIAELERLLTRRRITLITAESCTGGLIAAELTGVPGSSNWFEGAFVTYRLSAKTRMIGVATEILDRYGAV